MEKLKEIIKKIKESNDLEELKQLKEELKKLIDDAKTQELLDEIEKTKELLENKIKELEEKNKEVDDMQEDKESKKDENQNEERLLNKDLFERLEERSIKTLNILEERGDKKMGEEKRSKKEIIKDKNYRSAWAKLMMGRTDLNLEERKVINEYRGVPLNSSLTTTSLDFVEPKADTEGINNGGYFIPEEVSLEILRKIEQTSPFLADVAKTKVEGAIAYPYKKSSTGANFVKEGEGNVPESDEYAQLLLDGRELSKTISITWKLEKMAVKDFLNYIIEEISREMGEELAENVLYGDGAVQVKGATKEAITVTGTDIMDGIKKGIQKVDKREVKNAVIYISQALAHEIVFSEANKDNLLNGAAIQKIGTNEVKVDPFLKDTEILIGDPRNYRLNYASDFEINTDKIGRKRITDYTGYQIVAGAPVPQKFVHVTVKSI